MAGVCTNPCKTAKLLQTYPQQTWDAKGSNRTSNTSNYTPGDIITNPNHVAWLGERRAFSSYDIGMRGRHPAMTPCSELGFCPPTLCRFEVVKDTETRAHRRVVTGHRRPRSCLKGGFGAYPHGLPHRLRGARVGGVAVVGPLQALARRSDVVAVTDRMKRSI